MCECVSRWVCECVSLRVCEFVSVWVESTDLRECIYLYLGNNVPAALPVLGILKWGCEQWTLSQNVMGNRKPQTKIAINFFVFVQVSS